MPLILVAAPARALRYSHVVAAGLGGEWSFGEPRFAKPLLLTFSVDAQR